MKSVGKLDDFLADTFFIKSKLQDAHIFELHGFKGFSGHNIWLGDELIAQIHMATLKANGFVIYRKIFNYDNFQRYDYYNENGSFIYSSDQLDGDLIEYQSINMDNTSPFINQLYNILNYEYENVSHGNPRTNLILYIENLLNSMLSNSKLSLSVKNLEKDFALKNIQNEIHRIELDPIIRWSERQIIFKKLKDVRKKIINTKSRAHKFNKLTYLLNIFLQDLITRFKLIRKRPGDNIKGFLYQVTIGNIIWFTQTVRSNLGYSIALAIYGPFTFYFITQPMNPHAMWAVGKVRNAYINVMNSFDAKKDLVKDEVKTTVAAPNQNNISSKKVVDWQTRMGDFKAMQIALEANMVFAERMGRIEQMENQFSFPLTAENSWYEIERYIQQVKADLNFYKNLSPSYKKFLNSELERAIEDQKYIWFKMAQFFLDHPYISVDQDNKQTQRDYYVGRAFIFMNKMAKKFEKLNVTPPATHKDVYNLAELFSKRKVSARNILDSLQKNSALFNQKNIFSSDELRQYMKRHWEVIFIQQNKKQEASSFGLQAYTWSIKNAIWCLQSFYSIKKEDLKTLSYKHNLDNTGTSQIISNADIDSQFESLFHLINIEYVSLKKEFSHNLRADNESNLRELLVARLENFIKQRDDLYKRDMKVANNKRIE